MSYETVGSTIDGKYRIDALIREEDQGGLYRAFHTLTEKSHTIRVMAPHAADTDAEERFFAKAKAVGPVSHPNVAAVIDLGKDSDGRLFAVYDAPNSETLAAIIMRDGQMPAANVLELGKQIASALAAVHSAGVLHGNLTSDNVLLSEIGDGAVIAKLIGFGTPNVISGEGDIPAARPEDLYYVTPEQCSGSDETDERSDIYSLGVLLYQMLTGVVPFSGEKPTDVMLKHIEEPPAPMVAYRQDLRPEIEPVVLKALAKNPDMRHQTARELFDDLNSLSIGTAVGNDAMTTVAAASGGGFWKTAFMVVLGIGVLAAALIYATSVQRTEPTTVLQTDVEGLPVQPINPATGIEEQQLAAMPGAMSDVVGNSSSSLGAETLPGGDGYNPWATGAPPPGAPAYVPPGGQMITIPPGGSQFMPPDGCIMQPSGILLCPKPLVPPANTAVKPSPSPTPTQTNTNTAPVAVPSPMATPAPVQSPPPPANRPTPDSSGGDGAEGID